MLKILTYCNKEEKFLKISDKTINEFLENIATKPGTPAGGCIAALCAASSAALMEMVARHSINNENKSTKIKNYMEEVIKIASSSRRKFLDYMDEDTKAYKNVINAQKNKENDIEEYHKVSVKIPLEMAKDILKIIDIIKRTTESGSNVLVTDGLAALLMAKVTLNSLIYHIKFNLMYIKDKDFKEEINTEIQFIEEELKERLETNSG